MHVIAQRGEDYFLVTEDKDIRIGKGRIVQLSTAQKYPEMPIQSILARGYWEDVTADDATIQKALDLYKAR